MKQEVHTQGEGGGEDLSLTSLDHLHTVYTCPDNGILKEDCPIFEACDEQKEKAEDYIIGCRKKFGKECTCGPDRSCKGCNGSN
eukprot:10657052-Ditylum_brightwellii.AAC.1